MKTAGTNSQCVICVNTANTLHNGSLWIKKQNQNWVCK